MAERCGPFSATMSARCVVARGRCGSFMWTVSGHRLLVDHPGRFHMSTQAVLYVVAILFLVLAALPVPTRGIRFALLGAAAALAAYAWPVLTA
jgi:hypothetical protein